MTDLGFSASGWLRGALALVLTGLAGGLLVVVEHRPSAQLHTIPPVAGEVAHTSRLRLESSFPVSTWVVSVAGQPTLAQHSTDGTWNGVITAPSGAEILIEATAAGAPTQRAALRVVVDGDPQGERTVWGDGGVVATVRIP